jgi:hypothetical protein
VIQGLFPLYHETAAAPAPVPQSPVHPSGTKATARHQPALAP